MNSPRTLTLTPIFMATLLALSLTLVGCSSGDGEDPPKDADAQGSALLPAPFSLFAGDLKIPKEGSFHIPDNDVAKKTEPWKSAREAFTIDNDSDKAVTIESIEVKSSEDSPSEAFTVQDESGAPLDAKGSKLDPSAKYTFYINFQPVASGPHAATVVINYAGGGFFEFHVSGNGAAGLDLWPLAQPDLARLLGSPKTDEMTSTMAVDAKGSAWVSANVRGLSDADNYDIIVAHMTPKGDLGWARVLNGAYRDFSPDDAGNSETGGTAGSLSLGAGDIFVAGATSTTKTNAKFKALIVRLKGSSGATVWSKTYEPEAGAKSLSNSALAHAVDASGAVVLVTGKTKGGVMLLGLKPKDGALVYARALTVASGASEIGHAIAIDGKGGAWIGGESDARPFLAHLSKIADDPTVDWAGIIQVGAETRVNHIAVDSSGDALVTFGQSGSQRAIALARLGEDGTLRWATRLIDDKNNLAQAHALALSGASLWVGGRIGLEGFDTTQGDGLLLELSAADGKLRNAAVHWAGPGAKREVEHRVKAIAIANKHLYLAEQAFTTKNNAECYRGFWYKSDATLKPFSPDVITKADGSLTPESKAVIASADGQIHIKPAPDKLVLVPSKSKHDGNPPDADVLISRLPLP